MPVSTDDQLTAENPDTHRAHVRKWGEFKPSNTPLSAAELEHRGKAPGHKRPEEWAPRTGANVQEVNPLEDADEHYPLKR